MSEYSANGTYIPKELFSTELTTTNDNIMSEYSIDGTFIPNIVNDQLYSELTTTDDRVIEHFDDSEIINLRNTNRLSTIAIDRMHTISDNMIVSLGNDINKFGALQLCSLTKRQVDKLSIEQLRSIMSVQLTKMDIIKRVHIDIQSLYDNYIRLYEDRQRTRRTVFENIGYIFIPHAFIYYTSTNIAIRRYIYPEILIRLLSLDLIKFSLNEKIDRSTHGHFMQSNLRHITDYSVFSAGQLQLLLSPSLIPVSIKDTPDRNYIIWLKWNNKFHISDEFFPLKTLNAEQINALITDNKRSLTFTQLQNTTIPELKKCINNNLAKFVNIYGQRNVDRLLQLK